jgi:hypothetical protein
MSSEKTNNAILETILGGRLSDSFLTGISLISDLKTMNKGPSSMLAALAAARDKDMRDVVARATGLRLVENLGTKSALESALSGIKMQKSVLDEIAKHPRIRDQMQEAHSFRPDPEIFRMSQLPPMPPNPIYETNERLESVEQKLEAMLDVMERSASIATNLQSAAAGFIVEFQTSAAKTERGARTAIYLSALAVFVTLGQIAYTEFYKGPKDAAYQAAMITGIRRELAANREANLAGARQIADTFLATEKRAEATIKASKAQSGKEP